MLSEKKRTAYAVMGILVLGLALRTENLDWARFLYADEYRAFYTWKGNMLTPLLSLIYGIPARLFGTYHHLALLTSAVIGTAGILVTFLIGRDGCHRRTGLYAAFLLSVLVLHIRYSRTVFPCMLQSLFILLAFWRLDAFFADNGKDRRNIVLAGGCLGLAFLTYMPSYVSIAAFLILVAMQTGRMTPGERFHILALFGMSIMILPLLYAVYFSLRPGPTYVEMLLRLPAYSVPFFTAEMAATPILFPKYFFDYGGVLQLLLMAAGSIYCLFAWIRQRNPWLLGIFVFLLTTPFSLQSAGHTEASHHISETFYLPDPFSLPFRRILAAQNGRSGRAKNRVDISGAVRGGLPGQIPPTGPGDIQNRAH